MNISTAMLPTRPNAEATGTIDTPSHAKVAFKAFNIAVADEELIATTATLLSDVPFATTAGCDEWYNVVIELQLHCNDESLLLIAFPR